jgi:hypothetical protein
MSGQVLSRNQLIFNDQNSEGLGRLRWLGIPQHRVLDRSGQFKRECHEN